MLAKHPASSPSPSPSPTSTAKSSQRSRAPAPLVALLVACLLLGSACREDRRKRVVSREAGVDQAAARSDRALGAKLDRYIGCINEHARRVSSSHRLYEGWVGRRRPTCRQGQVGGVLALEVPVDGCIAAIAKARTMEPRLPDLEREAEGFAAALRSIDRLLREANRYYDSNEYRRDRCREGRRLHPLLLQAWSSFREREVALRRAVRQAGDALQRRELARLAKAPRRGLRYHRERVLIDARRTLDVLRAQSIVPRPDLAAVSRAVAAYRATVAAMDRLMTDKAARAGQWRLFHRQASAFLAACSAFRARRETKRRYDRAEREAIASGRGQQVEGHFAHLLRHYDELVKAANRMRFGDR